MLLYMYYLPGRPDIPDDNLEMMRCLGVQLCENKGCDVELWQWELEDHVR